MKFFIFIVSFLIPALLTAQTIKGTITNHRQQPLAGANIYWLGEKTHTVADTSGRYEISMGKSKKLIASYVGHIADTIEVGNQTVVDFTLHFVSGNEVLLQSRKNGIIISNLKPVKIEQITQTELLKAACCDLAGCFETQTTVQAHTTNIVTNAKELRILGLSGVYNQVLIDGFPMIQGLSYTYGISSIPGTLVDKINIAKGANSVLQGYESISGQINVETKEPDNTDRLLVNGYVNSFLEKHINGAYAFKKGKWSSLTALSTVQPSNKYDRDEDGFLDLPLLTRYMVLQKWKAGKENNWGWYHSIHLRYLNEQRIGGQNSFNARNNKGSNTIYGQTVNYHQPELWLKSGYRFNDAHRVVLYVSGLMHNQASYFGTVKYNAKQSNLYGNIQYEHNYLQRNDVKTGISYRFLNINETIGFTGNSLNRTYAGNYLKKELVPGVFFENTMRYFNNQLSWMLGLRLDNHNQFGWMFTPRTLVKWDITPKTVIRANAGTGWRTVNLFSENINLLVSSRNIAFTETLEPEKAWNYGINFTQKFGTGTSAVSGHISTDFYRTVFSNQIFPDYDTDPARVYISNFNGKSISNGFQIDVLFSFLQQFEFKAGYNFLDVYRMNDNEKKELQFNPRHRFQNTFSYKTLDNKFHFDANLHHTGRQLLPDTKNNPEAYRRPDYSEPFTVVNTQLTYNFKKIELYGGCENIFNFRQKQPIISWQDPFSPYFDTSSVWGPTRGREFYLGVRVRIK